MSVTIKRSTSLPPFFCINRKMVNGMSETKKDVVMEIQKCLQTPKPYRYPFGEKRKIHNCQDCGLYKICDLTR